MQIKVSSDHTAPEPQQELVCQADIAPKTQDKALTPDYQQVALNQEFDHILCDLVEDIHPFFAKQCRVGRIMGDTLAPSIEYRYHLGGTILCHSACRLCAMC